MKLTQNWFKELLCGQYICRLVQTPEDLREAQKLRFQVFNLELKEGLDEAFTTGRDEDPFDIICDHLIVEDRASGRIVGTYRLQSGIKAKKGLGYYSEQEFDFSPFESMRHEMLELGRACIHKSHRNLASLSPTLFINPDGDEIGEVGTRSQCRPAVKKNFLKAGKEHDGFF